MRRSNSRTIFLAVLSALGLFALGAQFYLLIANRTASITETIIRYFSFFTILTNLLVAICCLCLLIGPRSRPGKFFSMPSTLTAITVYILVVGIVYNVALRELWQPEGLQKLVDELLHSAIPALFLISWLAFVTKGRLRWKDVFAWLIYPAAYAFLMMFRGSISGFYPYPFIDLGKLGFPKVLSNIITITLCVLVISGALMGIAKLSLRSKAASNNDL